MKLILLTCVVAFAASSYVSSINFTYEPVYALNLCFLIRPLTFELPIKSTLMLKSDKSQLEELLSDFLEMSFQTRWRTLFNYVRQAWRGDLTVAVSSTGNFNWCLWFSCIFIIIIYCNLWIAELLKTSWFKEVTL